jgi:hypothetical protein
VKALVHLAPRAGATTGLSDALRTLATELRSQPAADAVSISTLQRLADDPLGPQTEYHGTLEVSGEAASAADLTELLAGLGDHVTDVADPARSTLLLGEDLVFVASDHAPLRYQYLMRRRADFDHAAYLARYRDIHAEFGLRTPGILGYSQFHVDQSASRAAAERAGLGVWEIDSVSQLDIASVEEFFAAVSKSSVPAEARADEERFVDRANSRDFISCVERSEADPSAAGAR